MQKRLFIILLLNLGLITNGIARHLKGGWIQYEYLSTNTTNQTNTYRIIVRQYLSCGDLNQGQIDDRVVVGYFDGQTNKYINKIYISLSSTSSPNLTNFDPCISNPPIGQVCYRIDEYITTLELPFNTNGYTLAVQRCCRIENINNVENSSKFGITYFNKIPGTIAGIDYSKNSSPSFIMRDTVVICHNTPFTFNFSATDINGDSLSYVFCDGITGGFNDPNNEQGAKPDPPAKPPYKSIAYPLPFSGSMPLGFAVTINSKTGVISGVAPDPTGDYVVSVCVNEYKNGVLIGTTKKEIHVNVADCELSAAKLNPTYITCNGFDFDFENLSGATNITSYLWDFGVKNIATDTSSLSTPNYIYKDTGVYTIKLIVKSQSCIDSTTAKLSVFPGFVPNFTASGFCFQNPFQFTNTTKPAFGFVDKVLWNFGDNSTLADTSILQNPPPYKYPSAGNRRVTLYAHSSKGCSADTIMTVEVFDKPIINLAFKDTLICSIDTLPLVAFTSAPTYKWSPNLYISDVNSLSPYVFPKDTTTYTLSVVDRGCVNQAKIKVNVLDFITVDAGANSNLCLTDTFKMQPVSYGLSYKWTATQDFINPNIKNSLVIPKKNTTYYVKANLGKCEAFDSITLFTFPYPTAIAKTDTSICRGQSVPILGSLGNDIGSIFKWSPVANLSDSTSLNPIAKPDFTTKYIFTTRFLTGCLKPKRDTVEVGVVQPFTVFAGRDTAIVYNQPLQLTALVLNNVDKKFTWTKIPDSLNTNKYLSNSLIYNPVTTFPFVIDSATYKVRAYTKEQCEAFDTINIKIFKSNPEIFVPNAFTPNGKNPIIRPIPVGISVLNYFNIYNRWGQILFTTKQIGKGWDGTVNGTLQTSGTFIYTVQGIDYLGKTITKKGTVVLIR